MDHDRGKAANQFRTSEDYRPRFGETPDVSKMQARASDVTRQPIAHQEHLQLLKYATGGFYHAHQDASELEFYLQDENTVHRHQFGHFDRMLTLFWYLTATKGGQTNFPRAGGLPQPRDLKRCYQGTSVETQVGRAVLWYNHNAKGEVSPYALHSGCAVEEGVKFAANVWVYNKHAGTKAAAPDPDHPMYARMRSKGKRVPKKPKKPKKRAEPEPEPEPTPDRVMGFHNTGTETVQVYYLQHPGQALDEALMEVPPGETRNMNTYVGHHFAVSAPGRKPERYTVSEAQTQTFRIPSLAAKPELLGGAAG